MMMFFDSDDEEYDEFTEYILNLRREVVYMILMEEFNCISLHQLCKKVSSEDLKFVPLTLQIPNRIAEEMYLNDQLLGTLELRHTETDTSYVFTRQGVN